MNLRPLTLSLERIAWTAFASLTYRGHVPSEGRAFEDQAEYLRAVASSLRISFDGWESQSLLFAFGRYEFGELRGRGHSHCLIKVPERCRQLLGEKEFRLIFRSDGTLVTLPDGSPKFKSASWKHGFSEIRNVRQHDSVVSYCQKGMDTRRANAYEMAKSSWAEGWRISASAANAVTCRRRSIRPNPQHQQVPLNTLAEVHEKAQRVRNDS